MFEYKRGATTFSVYRATGEDPGACEYHARAQCLAPWFIEGERAKHSILLECGSLSGCFCAFRLRTTSAALARFQKLCAAVRSCVIIYFSVVSAGRKLAGLHWCRGPDIFNSGVWW